MSERKWRLGCVEVRRRRFLYEGGGRLGKGICWSPEAGGWDGNLTKPMSTVPGVVRGGPIADTKVVEGGCLLVVLREIKIGPESQGGERRISYATCGVLYALCHKVNE